MSEPFHKLLVYLDGSEASVTAAMAAIMLAKRLQASLTAMYVINTQALQDLVKARIFVDVEEHQFRQELESDADRYLKHVRRLAQQKDIVVSTEKTEGKVHTVIRNYIQENGIDLLVLGGISQIHSRRDELMSETDRMMRTSPCPVLVVRDDEKIWDMFEGLHNSEAEERV